MSAARPFLYFSIGQAAWFAAVLSAAHGAPGWGEWLALAVIGVHVGLAPRWQPELKLIACAALLGALWESVVAATGVIEYPSQSRIGPIAPLWLPALWAVFAAQVNVTYRWLKSRILAAVALGAIAGPVSFHAGAALGALRFGDPWRATALLAAGWSVLLPTIMRLSRHWDGMEGGADRVSGQ